ncbi:MAG: sortase [bacterium]
MIYRYIKTPIKIKPEEHYKQEVIEIKRVDEPKLTLWDIINGFIKDINHLMISSKFAGFIIPASLIVVGVVIIWKQVWPEVEQYVRYSSGFYNSTNVALVAGDYVERVKYISDPGSEYFKNLTSEAQQSTETVQDPTSSNYKGRFTLSIAAIGLNDIPVVANVNSGLEEEYQKQLKNGLAHFSGTGLPLSPVKNNIVIYGHSASGDYYERTHDKIAAFSLLNKVKVGDIVEIKMEGKSYQYRIVKSKIVEPNDISILTGQIGQKTLTLFTCFPNGNRAKRFVAIAKPV